MIAVDGHNLGALCDALDWARTSNSAPSLIIAETVKGKGVSSLEDQPLFHNAILTPAQLDQAVVELDRELALAEEAK